MNLDAVLLSRLQFAITAMFHYLFPPLTIGLGVMMVIVEARYLITRDDRYRSLGKFLTRIFALSFALGVATGIVLEFEFGMNWASYSRFVGDVFGSPLAAEAILAFVLESTFLGLLVFGWNRLSAGMHFFATLMVSLGSILSSVWIVIANSWMQTPAGYRIVSTGGMTRAEITDFWAAAFNHTTVIRLLHVWCGALVLAALFLAAIGAYYALRSQGDWFAQQMLKLSLPFALFAALGSLITGHHHAMLVAKHQPAKLAAFEGHWKTGPARLYLFGLPDAKSARVRFGLAIPGALSLLIHGDPEAEVAGLDKFPRALWPPVGLAFQTYHAMVQLGLVIIVLAAWAWIAWLRGSLLTSKSLLRILVLGCVLGFIVNQLGWIAAEVGRQPWAVYGVMKTAEGVTASLSGGTVLWSLVMFVALYAVLFGCWIKLLLAEIRSGPDVERKKEPPEPKLAA
jgi:cytochrome d ubiquinol oxidase subunit I